jgi:hypothetical protein
MRVVAVAIACAAALALPAASAGAADECSGLPVCIPVAGPWVVIPAGAPPASANWLLACPQGIVGGVDARASEAAVAVDFPGRIGSPVNPGITTSNSLFFRGTYTGRARKATSYQPFIGCIPSAGGATTPMAFVRASAVKPGQPITIRVATLPVVPGRVARATLGCKPGERLLGSGQSVGLSTADAPTRAQLAAVHVVQARRGRLIVVRATRHGLAAGVGAEVQLQAECAR